MRKTTPAQSESDTNLSPSGAPLAGAQHRRRDPHAARSRRSRTSCTSRSRRRVSTPSRKAEGIFIEDTAGRRYMDFHGNNVHHIGYGHPRLKRAIAEQMDALPFTPRRYTCEPAVRSPRSWPDRAGKSVKGAVHDRRLGRRRGRDQDRARRDRPLQDALVLGRLPRRRLRRFGASVARRCFAPGRTGR